MKYKYLWMLLPLASLWLGFWVGDLVIVYDKWWELPTVLSLVAQFMLALWIAIGKIQDNE